MANGHKITAHQLQVIAAGTTDVVHDVTVGHPVGNHGEPPVLKGVRDADEVEDVLVGQVLPHGNLFAKALCGASVNLGREVALGC